MKTELKELGLTSAMGLTAIAAAAVLIESGASPLLALGVTTTLAAVGSVWYGDRFQRRTQHPESAPVGDSGRMFISNQGTMVFACQAVFCLAIVNIPAPEATVMPVMAANRPAIGTIIFSEEPNPVAVNSTLDAE